MAFEYNSPNIFEIYKKPTHPAESDIFIFKQAFSQGVRTIDW